MHPKLTLFCAFTRLWCLEPWLENLRAVKHDPSLVNLCFIVDGDQALIVNTLKKFAEAGKYRSFHVKMNTDWRPNETRLAIRRMRIADVKNQSKDLVARTDGEIILGFEDDTVFDRLDSFDRLINPIINSDRIGFVEGVQMGRWGANMIGAWLADDDRDPKQIKTLLPGDGYENITGGGWYGYATRRHLYLNHDYYTSSSQPWGPDVNFGFYVRQHGFECLVDWTTVFGHRDHTIVKYPDDTKLRLAQITFNKNLATGKWERTDHEQTRY